MQVKNLFFTITVLFTLLLPSILQAQGKPAKVVSIPDVNLAAAMRQEIGSSITTHTLLNLTQLDVPNRGITDLAGLEHAHNLRFLNLGEEYINGEGRVNSNTVSNFSPLVGLKNLRNLDLSRCSLSDVSFLSGLTQLTQLYLEWNSISDISPLEGLTQLTQLYLEWNSISDISPLEGLTQLIRLYLWNNPISDISPLEGLTQLTQLILWNNPISDISPLRGLTQLTRLFLGGNSISDISPLKGLTQLTNLSLGSNSISDISPLRGSTQLTDLSLDWNPISDISPLEGLTQLTRLYLWNNSISDISPLEGLTQLTQLNLGENSISDISPLAGLTQLKFLYIWRNPLNYASINTHIPAMQAKGVEVVFGNRIPTTLLRISDTAQEGVVNTALPLPFVVEVLDQEDRAFAGVPVTFTVATGGGKLNATTVTTDDTGRAAVHLRLGRTVGTTTVRVTAVGISQPVQFTATAIRSSSPVNVPDVNLRVKIMETLRKPLGETPTTSDMLKLTTLTASNANIHDLTGLQYASNLTRLSLDNNSISNVAPLAGLTELTRLDLRNNRISDVLPLVSLTQLEGSKALRALYLQGNPLSDISIHTHIPMLQAGGVNVRFDSISTQPRSIVRLVYFLPRDRQSQPDINAKMDRLMKDVQEFYAENMENHGFGRKTFQFETDAHGNAVVYHINGKYDDTYYHNESKVVWKEIDDQFDTSKNIYLTALDISSELIGIGSIFGVCGTGGSDSSHSGRVLIPASGGCFNIKTAGHELGHAFGLQHDFRDGSYIMSYGARRNIISQCAAEWLDVHRAFNPSQITTNERTTIEMLPPSLASPPNAIRFRFEVNDPDGLHQAQLHTETLSGPGKGYLELFDCKRLDRNPNSTVEFVTTDLVPKNESVSLQVIDVHGNFMTSQAFSIDITSLLPPSKVVSIPDTNLATAIRQKIGNSITTHTLLNLTLLEVPNRGITDLTGLEHAHNLGYLDLGGVHIGEEGWVNSNAVSNFSPLAGLANLKIRLSNSGISDISALAGLTQLTSLTLSGNAITDVSVLSELMQLTVLNLRDNAILDVSPLVGLNLTGREWDRTGLFIRGNPLSYASINTHIPAMQAKGVEVKFDNRTPTSLVKISVAAQQGVVNAMLPLPFVVEVRDQWNQAFAGVPVTFTVTAGGGKLSATTVTTDAAGRAEIHLTLGRTAGTTTVRVTAAEVSQPADFTAKAVLLSAPVAIPDVALHAEIASALGKPLHGILTGSDMLKLTTLAANNANIRKLTGLQYASNLTALSLNNNNISNIAPLAGLLKLTTLSLNNNRLSDVAPLEVLSQLKILSLEDNNLSDMAPLTSLTQLKTLQLKGNLLSYPSLYTHIPAIQAEGATVTVDLRTPATLVKVSGSQGVAGTAIPVIVEVQDAQGFGFAGVPVTFTVTAGSGHVSYSNVITGITGRAQTTLTLGITPGKNTISVAAVEVRQPALFTITAINANSPVTIPDANLRAKIAEILGKPVRAQLTAGDMLTLTKLEAPNANIQSLIGLEHAHNLRELNLSGEYIAGEGWVNSNTISDFSPIAGLTQLIWLDLSTCSVSDVSFLSDLTQLLMLRLHNNPVSDISALAGLTQLTFLVLTETAISDVSPLAGLTRLWALYLYNTAISEVSALSNLTQLTRLGISGTSVSDVSPLAELTQLTYLHLGWNAISDISALTGLTQLTTLTLSGNTITDVSALSGLTRLEVLYLRNNAILDVSPLVGLDLPGTQRDSTGLYIEGNPLNYASVHTHIPAMQARGVEVKFDNRAHSALVRISGDTQEGEAGTTLAAPFVVEALDAHGIPITRLSVRFRVIEGNGKLSTITAITDANGRAQTTLTLSSSPGVNKVRVTAAGITYPVIFTAIATEVLRLAADVNSDGIVNIQDLVLVASSFGQTGQSRADVNGDGIVNIQDLVLVASAFGEGTAAAPTLHPSDLEGLTAAEVQDLLTQARQMALTDPVYSRGIAVLEQLLALLLPRETALLPNYPNPFNPETWIPYQLAEPAKVTLHIYSVNGALVQTLALGHQPAGIYHTRSRAAYWDGRNEQGERVASGIYFYTLTTGNLTATRKMLIKK